ncbi:MAG: GNAT family N-acetyltransferase, partial [bacterium]|nr:GNAT family N-acetyltransferase [bacterium]
IRRAELSDLDVLVSWLGDGAECELWAGHRVSFPVDLGGLPHAIEWDPSRVSLNVSPHNAPAVSLYRSLGFVEAESPDDEPKSESSYMERAV